MNESEILDLLFAILPAIIVGLVSFYFFHSYSKNEENRRRFLLLREKQKTALPIRLQAYERLALFLERISPGKILFRVQATSEEAEAYANLLIANIEQEFEHNLAQQIYVSNECWDYIKTAKNSIITSLRKAAAKEDISTADELREIVLKSLMDKQPPTDAALSYIKKEVRSLA
ncbi:hypothetical protein [Christiangramia forsetii]|uniref:Uncharacterized protein n=2 Tax=Christiangramia forsetii TaxID=411153 RepID=A0M3U7_CHRFK|nr:hypothetical protein [Christiangramia forsetii]GGG24939.1 hypothetical protein GCM10011532_05340 [Christiangramia forsetii]CAL67292.1 conserved hypothetical protein [Christiangramia forsetii KT0803]